MTRGVFIAPPQPATPGLPLPQTSAIAAAFGSTAFASQERKTSDSEARPRETALLAGYDSAFATPHFRSAFDTAVDPAVVCAAATATARAIFRIATAPVSSSASGPSGPLPPPTSLVADCGLVSCPSRLSTTRGAFRNAQQKAEDVFVSNNPTISTHSAASPCKSSGNFCRGRRRNMQKAGRELGPLEVVEVRGRYLVGPALQLTWASGRPTR